MVNIANRKAARPGTLCTRRAAEASKLMAHPPCNDRVRLSRPYIKSPCPAQLFSERKDGWDYYLKHNSGECFPTGPSPQSLPESGVARISPSAEIMSTLEADSRDNL